MKKIEAEIITCDKLYYTFLKGEFDEENLFLRASENLKLNLAYQHKMAFVKNDDIYHIFFTHFSNLKAKNAYPLPFIFKLLTSLNLIKEKNFCILCFEKKYSFICFYENDNFTNFKTLPQLENKDITGFKSLCENARILKLLNHYKSELLISLNDELNLAKFFDEKIKILKLESLYKKPLNELLKQSSLLSKNENFIKEKEIDKKPFIKLAFGFVGVYILFLLIFLLSSYPKYKEHKNTKLYNQNMQDTLLKLDENISFLSLNLKDSKQKLENIKFLNDEKMGRIETFKNALTNDKLLILSKLILFLNENGLKISALNIDENIKLSFNNKDAFKKASMLFKENANFKLLRSSEKELFLGFKNE
ncbi:hypothetical protein FMM56_02215 [Campylobacter sp. LR264d]|uniref:hypothetical protein n=1 Tax=Campylobacter sp. LR264d TaxID=2593544 RepID=UPI00123C77D8|nr:hypothetical protein [Campylobacter sp. LR264d]KAA6233743.1 hypothetical protein FMM56_02215 [Campylobacter sp. LR264d]